MQLGRSKTSITLAVFAAIAAMLEFVTMGTSGMVAMWAVISIGFFNSVMFPNIFALSVDGSGQERNEYGFRCNQYA